MGKKTVKVIVSGRVQGVGYRMFAQSEARKLALSGTVRNLDSGQVEVVVSGEVSLLNAFYRNLQQGPTFGNVTGLKVEELEYKQFSEFIINY